MLIAALVAATCSGSVFAQDEVGNNAKANLEAKVENLGWGGLVDISVDKMNKALKEKFPNTGLTLMSFENARGKNIFFVLRQRYTCLKFKMVKSLPKMAWLTFSQYLWTWR